MNSAWGKFSHSMMGAMLIVRRKPDTEDLVMAINSVSSVSSVSIVATICRNFISAIFYCQNSVEMILVIDAFKKSLKEAGEAREAFIDSRNSGVGNQLEQARLVARSVLDPRFGEVWNSPNRVGYNPGSSLYYGKAQKMRNNLVARVKLGFSEARDNLALARDLRLLAEGLEGSDRQEYLEEANRAMSKVFAARVEAKTCRKLLQKASDLELVIMYEEAGNENEIVTKFVGGAIGSFGSWGITQPQA